MRRSVALVLTVLLTAPVAAHAQSSPSTKRHSPTWIAVGAGAGFGVGLYAGFARYDESINSDRKTWTTAPLSAAGGGLIAFLVTRARRDKAAIAPNAPTAPIAPAAPLISYSL